MHPNMHKYQYKMHKYDINSVYKSWLLLVV